MQMLCPITLILHARPSYKCLSWSLPSIFCVIVAVAPIAEGQISYRNSQAYQSTNHPQENLSQTARGPLTRFLGWNRALAKGPEYFARFHRRRARLALPLLQGQLISRFSDFSASTTSGVTYPGFQQRPSLPAGFIPVSVAAADFNADGNADWVVANAGDNDLWLYLGNGDGTSQLPTILPTGLTPTSVTVGDLRGNGRQDIIVAEANSASVGVFLSNGDGTFAAEQQYFLSDAPLTVAMGDFNGDGKLDIIAGLESSQGHALAVLPGVGNGQLGSAIYSSVASTVIVSPEVTDISLADVNNDGILDAVITMTGGVLAFLGKGDGSFVQSQPVASPFSGVISYTAAEIGDVDEDGCPDVVVTDSLAFATVYSGNCDGTFTQAAQFRLGDVGISLALADVNGDGHLDILSGSIMDITGVTGDVGGNLLSVLLGDGHGNFGPPAIFRGDPSLAGLAVVDVNNDHHPDVISVNEDGDSATVFLNDGTGNFGPPFGLGLGYNSGTENVPVSGMVQSDLNGDGKKDLALIELPATQPGMMQLTTLINEGNGQFAPPARYSVFPTSYYLPSDFVLADFRNTGHPDFLAIGLSPDISFSVPFIAFAPNNGDGTFGTATTTNPPTANGVMAVGDFNKDGKLDFVTIGGGDTGNVVALNVFLGNGDGTFNAQPSVLFGGSSPRYPVSVYVGDFNADGNLDVLVYLSYNQVPATADDVYEFFGNGNGTFQPPIKLISNSEPLTLVDVNGDGVPDLVTCNNEISYPSVDQSPVISVYLGQLNGSFVLAHTYQPYPYGALALPGWRGTADGGQGFCTVADFNGDGKPDIAVFQRAVGGSINSFVQFLAGNGDGSFTPTYDLFRFEKPISPQFGLDLNGDGIADLVELDSWTSSFNYLPGAPAPPFQIGLLAEPVVGTGQLQITMDVPSTSTTTFALSASAPDILVPSSVTIPAGTISQVVEFTFASGFNNLQIFAITAQSGSYTATAYGSAWSQPSTGLALGLQYPSMGTSQGGTAGNYNAGVGTLGDYSTTVQFSCTGLPAQAQCIFDPPSLFLDPNTPDGLGGGGSAQMFVNTTSSLPVGNYAFTVLASDGAVSASTPATLEVTPGSPPGPILDVLVSGGAGFAPVGYPTSLVAFVTNNGQVTASGSTLSISVAGPASILSASLSQGACSSPTTCNLGTLNVGQEVEVNLVVQPNSAGNVTVSATAISAPPAGNSNGSTGSDSFLATDFSVSASPASASVNAGGTATYQLTLAPTTGGYGNPVSLSCSGGPANASCTVSPGSLLVSALNVTATITVTTAASSASSAKHRAGFYSILLPITTLICGFAYSRKRRRLIFGASLLTASLMLFSCGGGTSTGGAGNGGGAAGGGSGSGGSPSPSYSIAIQAASGTNIKTTTVSLTVQ
jgi:hypothetical protein